VKSQLRRAFTKKNVEARVPESPASANDSSLDLATLNVFAQGLRHALDTEARQVEISNVVATKVAEGEGFGSGGFTWDWADC